MVVIYLYSILTGQVLNTTHTPPYYTLVLHIFLGAKKTPKGFNILRPMESVTNLAHTPVVSIGSHCIYDESKRGQEIRSLLAVCAKLGKCK